LHSLLLPEENETLRCTRDLQTFKIITKRYIVVTRRIIQNKELRNPDGIIAAIFRCSQFCGKSKNDEEWRLLGYKTPVRTSQETHYVSTAESSQLMLCKIWGPHGSDYEECRLLGYKTPVRTSQETPYVSTTESCQLMLCKI
jgi:hypothetical protein